MFFLKSSCGFYVHIAFCLSKCPYCAFSSVEVDSYLVGRYVDALLEEISRMSEGPRSQGLVFDTLYIGGGTPTILSTSSMERIISRIFERFAWAPGPEITCEANPGAIGAPKLAAMLSMGINRLSLGVQSFHDRELKTLGRIHSSDDARRTFDMARILGFKNVGIDLMFGIPGQTLDSWTGDLETAVDLSPEHISTYSLSIEPGTPFWEMAAAGQIRLPDEETVSSMYEEAIGILTDNGYVHYEISNFAKPGFKSRHNLHYWNRDWYIGVGASAHSFSHGKRFWNFSDPIDYIDSMLGSGCAMEGEEEISYEEALREEIFLGLRQLKGLDLERLRERYNFGFDGELGERMHQLVNNGFLEMADSTVRLTRKGLLVADSICTELCI